MQNFEPVKFDLVSRDYTHCLILLGFELHLLGLGFVFRYVFLEYKGGYGGKKFQIQDKDAHIFL